MVRLLPFAVGMTLLAGCSQIDYLDLEPKTATLRQRNNLIWLRAMPKSQRGTEFPSAGVSWEVKDPAIAQVDHTGKLTPVKSGRTEVVARHGKISATLPVEVVFAEKMSVEPNPVKLKADGEPVELRVKVLDYRGRELRDRTPLFRGGDKSIVTMGQNNAFPGSAGTTEIEVRVDDLVQKVDVIVEK